MADTHGDSPLLKLPMELRDHIYRMLFSSIDQSKPLHIYMYRSRRADKPRAKSLTTCFGLIHTNQQLRREALPELLARLQITLHPAPASSLKIFTAYYRVWIPNIRKLCIADADVFLEDRATHSFAGLETLLGTVARQSGGTLRDLSISFPRSDWNDLAASSCEEVLSLRFFRELLKMRGLQTFVICQPPERIDRPRWGRKRSWDIVARHMSEEKWKIVEALVASVVTARVENG